MKKFIVLILFVTPIFLSAQDFEFGFRTGFNLGNYQGEDNGGNYKFAAYGGAMFTHNLSDIVSLQTEFNYSMQGFRDHVNGESVRVDLDYISMPLLVQFTLRNYGQFKFVFGPQIAYLVRSNEDPDNFHQSLSITEFSGDDIFEDYDYGAVIGMEYEINEQFFIQARYYHGISKFYNQNAVNSDAKNRVFSLGLAFRI